MFIDNVSSHGLLSEVHIHRDPGMQPPTPRRNDIPPSLKSKKDKTGTTCPNI